MDRPAPITAASSLLERLPLSRWHWRLVVLVGVGTFFDLYEVFLGGDHGFVLAGGAFVTVEVAGSRGTQLTRIKNNGQVTGACSDALGGVHGIIGQ